MDVLHFLLTIGTDLPRGLSFQCFLDEDVDDGTDVVRCIPALPSSPHHRTELLVQSGVMSSELGWLFAVDESDQGVPFRSFIISDIKLPGPIEGQPHYS